MGRGTRSESDAVASLASSVDLRRSGLQDRDARFVTGVLAARAGSRHLPAHEQRHLVAVAQDASERGDTIAANRARELLISSNERYMRQMVERFESSGVDEQALMQACRIGMNRAVESYDPDKGSGFLHYATRWMHASINETIEHERGSVRLKSKADQLAKRLQALLKEFDNRDERPSVTQLVDALNSQGLKHPVSAAQVADVLPYIAAHPVRLDAPLPIDEWGGDGTATYHDLIDGGHRLARRKRAPKRGGKLSFFVADPDSDQEKAVLSEEEESLVAESLAAVRSPVDRVIMEMYWGLSGREGSEQKAMFDGVYRDADGTLSSAEDSIIADRAERGETVNKRGQKELDSALASGDVTFEPGTDEARELYETFGAPPTSGTIQYSLKKAREEMAAYLGDIRDDYRYRGDNELENSGGAQDAIREALVRRHVVSPSDARKLKVSRPNRQGEVTSKGPLRVMAEEHGLVNEDGRVRADVPAAEPRQPRRVATPAPTPAAPRRTDRDVTLDDLEGLFAAATTTAAPAKATPPQPVAASTKSASEVKAADKPKPRTADKPKTEALHCQIGNHAWNRPVAPGRKPTSCPQHRVSGVPMDRERLADQKATRSAPAPRKTAAAKPATETLHCQIGNHPWERPKVRGAKPKSCPQHRVAVAKMDNAAIAERQRRRDQAAAARTAAQQAFRAAQTAQAAAQQAQEAADAVAAQAATAQQTAQEAERAAGEAPTETQWCINGQHPYERPVGAKGRPPLHCPEHRRRPAAAKA